jgi:spermidine/putrescine-binding protein
MNQSKIKFSWILLIFAAGVLALTGCMTAKPKPGEIFSCARDSDVNKVIAPEASLENFSCIIKKWDGADTLHFNVAVKNISDEDQRFKVNIFLANGKAVGGLLPRKIKKGLIKPGDTAKFTYPVKGVNCSPGKIDLFIRTMSK